jgi:transcriptional regulator with XRE-family HTH domain
MKQKSKEVERLLAENMRRERKDRGWTRKELARKAGNLQEAVIVKTESMISFPTAKNLARIARALGIEPFELLMPDADLKLLRAVKGSIGAK